MKKTALYRHFDKSGVLLYIGISSSATARAVQHHNGSRWADLIARIDVEHYDTREEALAAESAAIKTEKPPFNVVGNGPPVTWAILDINEGWADGWYRDFADIVELMEFFRAAFPEAALVAVPYDGGDLCELCRRVILGRRMFKDHPEWYARWELAEKRLQENAS